MYVCMYDVCMCACAQRKAKAKSSKPPERCVIRGESGRQKGTLEEMMQLEHHIRKGCLQQPLPWKELWLDTKVQPKTELQERLGMFDTSRNESRHSKFNQLADHISHMDEDLMEVKLEFEIYFTNREYDMLLGRVDPHSLSLFSWDDVGLNKRASKLLIGQVPFPCAAGLVPSPRPLKPHEPVGRNHPRWEPLGFEYLRYLAQMRHKAAELAALKAGYLAAGVPMPPEPESEATDISEAALPLEEHASSAHVSKRKGRKRKGAQQGSAHWNSRLKALTSEPYRTKPITPTSEEEIEILAAALQEAHSNQLSGPKMYEAAAEAYLGKVVKLFLKIQAGHVDPPVDSAGQLCVQCARTSEKLIKKMVSKCTALTQDFTPISTVPSEATSSGQSTAMLKIAKILSKPPTKQVTKHSTYEEKISNKRVRVSYDAVAPNMNQRLLRKVCKELKVSSHFSKDRKAADVVAEVQQAWTEKGRDSTIDVGG